MSHQKPTRRKNTEGVALITAMIFLVVMGLFATFIMSRISNHRRHVSQYRQSQDTYLGMISAADESLVVLGTPVGVDSFWDNTRMIGASPAQAPYVLQEYMDIESGNPLQSIPNVYYAAYSTESSTRAYDEAVTYATEQYIQSDGTPGIRRSIINMERIPPAGDGNINIWTNAIFAAVRDSGNLMNGNVTVHGSVHILGEGLGAGDTAMSMSGNSGIFNNYDGMPADLEARIPSIVNADGVETLDAEFRVKQGVVEISGSNTIGVSDGNNEADDISDGTADFMDGIYVGDITDTNWGGNSTNNGIPNDGYVNGYNGWNTGYDLGNAISYPEYSSVVNKDYNGQVFFDPSDSTSYYLSGQTPYQGDMSITVGSSNTNFYYNATTGNGSNAVIGKNPGSNGMPTKTEIDAMAANDEFVVWYDGNSDVLVVNGRVAVKGDIEILAGNGQNKFLDYEGQGSLLAYGNGSGDITLTTSLKTTGFPQTNIIGLMAQNDFEIGKNSQLDIMGGFYAQGIISVNKQTNIVGTIVGDTFDVGSQVPDIYQVPELSNSWLEDMRMIGADPIGKPSDGDGGNVWFEVGVLL